MKLSILLSLAVLCWTVTALPVNDVRPMTSDRSLSSRNKKLPRQEELVVVTPVSSTVVPAPVVSTVSKVSKPPTSAPTTLFVSTTKRVVVQPTPSPPKFTVPTTTLGSVETGSVQPVGDHVEVVKSGPSTVKFPAFVEGESLSSPSPVDLDLIAGVSTTKLVTPSPVTPVPVSVPSKPVGKPLPTGSPTTTTVRPGEEEESSEEENEENEEVPEPPQSETEDAPEESPEEEDEEEEEEEEEDEARSVSVRDDDDAMIVEALMGRQDAPSPKLDAFIPGYITEQGEILVPIDTLEEGLRYSIIPDKKTQRGRLDIKLRQDLDDDDDESVEDEAEDAASSEEDDDVVPVRLSSFNIIYKKKKDSKDKEEDADEEEETGDGGDETGPEGGPEGGSGETSVEPSKENNNIVQIKSVTQGQTYRPAKPPLQAIPATRPTGEDDENELRRLLYGGQFRLYGLDHNDDDESYFYTHPLQQKQYYSYAPSHVQKSANLPYLNYYE